MRYSAEHKQETRKRIVQAAARQFCRHGGKGLAIADLMRELGLTHGGFYKHFDSKQQLLAEAISGFDEMEAGVVDAVSKTEPGAELRMIIEHYLRLEHCSNPGAGCPMAALSSEIARYPHPVRVEIDRAMQRRIKRLARFVPGKTEKERERNCQVLMSGIVGALNVARSAVNQKSRKAILDASKEFYIKAFFRNLQPKK